MNQKTRWTILISLLMMFMACLCTLVLSHDINSSYAETSADTPNLEFTLINDGNEYNVRAANRQLTKAVIPVRFNGKPVTEIADNGFASCTLLEKVIIPSTVKKIGNNAFRRCTNLSEVNGMGGVKTYGIAAFSMCSKLEYLIMPTGVSSLGANMLSNVSCTLYSRMGEEELAELGTSWLSNYNGDIEYGNGIVFRPYQIDDEWGLTIPEGQNLNLPGESIVISSFIDVDAYGNTVNAKVINISEFAFELSTIDNVIIKHPDGGNFNHAINIEPYAFSFSYIKNISIEVNITVSGEDEGIFSNCEELERVTLPNSLTELPKYTFSECSKLSSINNLDASIEENHLSDKIVTIGDEAFGKCINIKELYIGSEIEEIRQNAFIGWGKGVNKQKIFINISEAKTDNWSILWNNGIDDQNCEVVFTEDSEFTVNFITEYQGVQNVTGGAEITVPRGTTLDSLDNVPVPTSTSHNFTNIWYTTESRDKGSEFSLDTPIKKKLTLYAGWEIKKYIINFADSDIVKIYKKSTNELLNGISISCDYGLQIDFYCEIEKGHDLIRADYDSRTIEPNADGTYTINAHYDGEVQFITELHRYGITYSGVRGGKYTKKDYYTVDELPLQLVNPVWEEAYKEGLWDIPTVTKNSLRDIEVTALWSSPIIYSITYENLRGGLKGANNKDSYTANDLIGKDTLILDNPAWTQAYGFGTWDMPIINESNLKSFTATAVWSNPVAYSISYENLRAGTKGANNHDSYTADDLIGKDTLILDNPTWLQAYESGIWDMPIINDSNLKNFTATAVWSDPIIHTITFVLDNDPYSSNPNGASKQYTVEDAVTLAVPKNPGYIGDGKWTKNGTVISGWNPYTYYEDMKLIVQWGDARKFTVFLDFQGGDGVTSQVSATYRQAMPSATAPTRVGWTFHGYYTETNGNGIKYYDNNMNSVRNWDIPQNTTLYANWEANKYNVYFDPQGGSGGTSIVLATFYGEMPSATAPTRVGYTFDGYYTEMEGNGTKYYDNNMNSVRNWDIPDDSTLYANWQIIVYTVRYKLEAGWSNPSSNPVKYDVTKNTIVFAPPTKEYYEGWWIPASISEDNFMDFISNGDIIINMGSRPKTYEIEYNHNGGVKNPNNPDNIKYGEEKVLYEPTKSGYHFVGWRLNGKFVTVLQNITDNITLDAVWEEEGTVYAPQTNDNAIYLYEFVVSVKLPNTAFKASIELIVGTDVQRAYIYSDVNMVYNMFISVDGRSTDVVLILDNFSMRAPVGRSAITMTSQNTLYLRTYKSCAIYGGSGVGGTAGVAGSATSLGGVGGDGGDGCAAIVCTRLCIEDTISIYGGTGGVGGNGGYGRTGGNGGIGGNGAYANS